MRISIKARMLFAFAIVVLFTGLPSFWYRMESASIVDQNGAKTDYGVYKSMFLGNLCFVKPFGIDVIVYPSSLSVTYPSSGKPIFLSKSLMVLNPIRSLIPIDKPLALGHDPRLEISKGRVSLNVTETERITVQY
jgi:hypothetical protein